MAQTLLTSTTRVTTLKPVGTDPAVIARLSDCLAAASAYMEKRIGRLLGQATYTKRLDGNGTPVLVLPYWPATAITNLTVNGGAWTVMLDADTDTGQQCTIDGSGRMLLARSYPFPRGIGNVQVTWTAGFQISSDPTVSYFPDDIQQATAMVTHLLLLENVRIGEGSLTLGPEQVQNIARNPDDYKFIESVIAHWRGW